MAHPRTAQRQTRAAFFAILTLPWIASCSSTQPGPALTLPVQAAWHSESDEFEFHGTQFLISGQDRDPVHPGVVGALPVPGIVTPGDPDKIVAGLAAQTLNNVEGAGGFPSVERGPSIGLDLRAAAYGDAATVTEPGGTFSDVEWGGSEDPTIVRITGTMEVAGAVTGGGVLVVEGNLTGTATFTWYGVVLVLGDVTWAAPQAATHVYGTLLSKGAGGPQVVGGNAEVLYSSEALRRVSTFIAGRKGRLPEIILPPD
jgi:hypothetical protein